MALFLALAASAPATFHHGWGIRECQLFRSSNQNDAAATGSSTVCSQRTDEHCTVCNDIVHKKLIINIRMCVHAFFADLDFQGPTVVEQVPAITRKKRHAESC